MWTFWGEVNEVKVILKRKFCALYPSFDMNRL